MPHRLVVCFVLCQFFLVCTGTSTNTGADGGYFDDTFATESFTVPYGDGNIIVWEHAKEKGRFYMSPLATVSKNSLRCQHNNLTANAGVELRFNVRLWSDQSKKAVYNQIKKMKPQSSVRLHDVEPIPMMKVRVDWKRNFASGIQLNSEWISNTKLNREVTFLISCRDMALCNRVKSVMEKDPMSLYGLELIYVINAKSVSEKNVKIEGRHLITGAMRSRLQTLPGAASDSSIRYINAEDKNEIVKGAVTEIMASVIMDAGYAGEDINLEERLNSFFEQRALSTSQFTPLMWQSTFWDPLIARPDKEVQTLNEIFVKDESDDRSLRIIDSKRAETWARSSSGRGGFLFWSRNSNGQSSGSSNSQQRVLVQDVTKALQQINSKAEWNGERFIVKEMDLYKLNLATMQSTETVAFGGVVISQYETIHTVPIAFVSTDSSEEVGMSNQVSFKDVWKCYQAALSYNSTDTRNDAQQTDINPDQTNYTVQLIGGHNNGEGRVEITRERVTGTVCDDGWDNNDAKVICRMLGFNGPCLAKPRAAFGRGSGKIWLDDVGCRGHEQHLSQCSHLPWGSTRSCSHSEDAGVVCSDDRPFTVELVGGSGKHEGRVEIIRGGTRGTVCDDNWDNNDAMVVCRMLGYNGTSYAKRGGTFGRGSGKIWLDAVNCKGYEQHLSQCSMLPWGTVRSCSHAEDAGVTCSNTSPIEIELVGGSSNMEGRVEITKGGVRGTVCDDYWSNEDAAVVCKMLGFNGPSEAVSGGGFPRGSGKIWLDDVRCLGYEADLSLCPHRGWDQASGCSHSEDAGVICSNASTNHYCRHANQRCRSYSYIGRQSLPAQSDCEGLCNRYKGCKAFDWSMSSNTCTLFSTPCPQGGLYGDSVSDHYVRADAGSVWDAALARVAAGHMDECADICTLMRNT